MLSNRFWGNATNVNISNRPETWMDGQTSQQFVWKFDWELFDYLPYSPDLTPSDFLFLNLKKWPAGQKFENTWSLKTAGNYVEK